MKTFKPDTRETFKPKDIPAVKMPKGFEDSTWHNDICPSMLNEDLNARIWVEHNDPKNREVPKYPQFALTNGIQATYEVFKETDDYEEILKELKFLREYTKLANEFSKVLREWLTEQEMEIVRERNHEEELKENKYSICHSHDFCDANEAMIQAMKNLDIDWIFADEDPEAKEIQTDLINKAWNRAKANDFKEIGKNQF